MKSSDRRRGRRRRGRISLEILPAGGGRAVCGSPKCLQRGARAYTRVHVVYINYPRTEIIGHYNNTVRDEDLRSRESVGAWQPTAFPVSSLGRAAPRRASRVKFLKRCSLSLFLLLSLINPSRQKCSLIRRSDAYTHECVTRKRVKIPTSHDY